jgi:hypothetical protein
VTGLAFALLLQSATPVAAPPLPDAVLATQRGGFRLPNGIDIALAVQTDTAVNGLAVLRTVFRVDQGAPTLTVYAPKAGESVAAPSTSGTTQSTAMTSAQPTVSFDNRSGVRISPGLPNVGLAVGTSVTKWSDDVPKGLAEVSSGAVTDNGTITHQVRGGLQTVTLDAKDLTVTHLAGNAFGSAVANSGSDRAIDTATSVSIDLRNAGPDVLGSTMFRIQDIANDAVGMRVR